MKVIAQGLGECFGSGPGLSLVDDFYKHYCPMRFQVNRVLFPDHAAVECVLKMRADDQDMYIAGGIVSTEASPPEIRDYYYGFSVFAKVEGGDPLCCWNGDMLDPWNRGEHVERCAVKKALSRMRQCLDQVYNISMTRVPAAGGGSSIPAFVDSVQPCLVIKTYSKLPLEQQPANSKKSKWGLRIACVIVFDRKPSLACPLDVWHIWESRVLDMQSVMLSCMLRRHEAVIWARDGDAMLEYVAGGSRAAMSRSMAHFMIDALYCVSRALKRGTLHHASFDVTARMESWFRRVSRERENALLCGALHARSSSVLKLIPIDVIKQLLLEERRQCKDALDAFVAARGVTVRNFEHLRFP